MKIKAKNPRVFGAKLVVPFDGTIIVGEKGITEVSENAAKALLTITSDWEEVGSEKKLEKKEKEEKVKDEDEQFLEDLKGSTLEDLIKLAQDAGYPEAEYKRFSGKQKLMVAYLTKKYNEAALEKEGNE